MEKERVRRVIRREVSIVTVFVLLFLVARWLDGNRSDQMSTYKKRAGVVGVYSRTDLSEPEEHVTESGARYSITRISEFTGIFVMFPKETTKAVMTAALQRDFYDIKDIDPIVEKNEEAEKIKRLYDREGNRIFDDLYYRIELRKIELFLLLFAYPLSLLIRFIVVRTMQNLAPKT